MQNQSGSQVSRCTKLLSSLICRTIQRRLKEAGLFYGRVIKIEKLTTRHKEKRVQYSKDMKDCKWKRVFFSDEKTFQLGSTKSRVARTHRSGQRICEARTKLHVWGAIVLWQDRALFLSR